MPAQRKNLTRQQALDTLEQMYDEAVNALRASIKALSLIHI